MPNLHEGQITPPHLLAIQDALCSGSTLSTTGTIGPRTESIDILGPTNGEPAAVIYSAHPADIMPVAGTAALLAERMPTVLVDLTAGSAAPSETHDTQRDLALARCSESLTVAKALGMVAYINLGYPDGELPDNQTELTWTLTQYGRIFLTAIGIVHPPIENDYHFDHHTANQAVNRALFNARNEVGILPGVERAPDAQLNIPAVYTMDTPGLIGNDGQFAPIDMLVGLTPKEIKQKCDAFTVFATQGCKRPANGDLAFIDRSAAEASIRGHQTAVPARFPFAEGLNQARHAGVTRENRLGTILRERVTTL
jgi:LmbE family N-acetylglucosaminyl deacetylase